MSVANATASRMNIGRVGGDDQDRISFLRAADVSPQTKPDPRQWLLDTKFGSFNWTMWLIS